MPTIQNKFPYQICRKFNEDAVFMDLPMHFTVILQFINIACGPDDHVILKRSLIHYENSFSYIRPFQ